MAEMYKGKYRNQSARCPKWDYRSKGAYFITICTQNRKHYFGEINSGKMILSEAGLIVNRNWLQIPIHFNHVELDSFIVMPNHFHAIIIIKNNIVSKGRENVTINKTTAENEFYSDISPKPGSVSTIVRSFKSSCSKEINLKRPELNFIWQPRFYDIIIRNRLAHKSIRNYIVNNPKNWKEDLFSPK